MLNEGNEAGNIKTKMANVNLSYGSTASMSRAGVGLFDRFLLTAPSKFNNSSLYKSSV
jgi:hypothetical protein